MNLFPSKSSAKENQNILKYYVKKEKKSSIRFGFILGVWGTVILKTYVLLTTLIT